MISGQTSRSNEFLLLVRHSLDLTYDWTDLRVEWVLLQPHGARCANCEALREGDPAIWLDPRESARETLGHKLGDNAEQTSLSSPVRDSDFVHFRLLPVEEEGVWRPYLWMNAMFGYSRNLHNIHIP